MFLAGTVKTHPQMDESSISGSDGWGDRSLGVQNSLGGCGVSRGSRMGQGSHKGKERR